jgi:hypothetical protein
MEAAAPMEDSAVQPPMILEWGNPSLKGIGGYGSGGGGSDVNGMGGGFAVMEAPQPETGLVPPDVVGGGEPEQITPQATAELRAALEPVTGSGPILGIRSEEETQIYNDAVMGILDEQINNYQPPSGNTIPLIRWLQISLAAITVVTGISALFVWKRLRF